MPKIKQYEPPKDEEPLDMDAFTKGVVHPDQTELGSAKTQKWGGLTKGEKAQGG